MKLFLQTAIIQILLSLFVTMLVERNKQFFMENYEGDFLASHLNHRQCTDLQFCLSNSLIVQLKRYH